MNCDASIFFVPALTKTLYRCGMWMEGQNGEICVFKQKSISVYKIFIVKDSLPKSQNDLVQFFFCMFLV